MKDRKIVFHLNQRDVAPQYAYDIYKGTNKAKYFFNLSVDKVMMGIKNLFIICFAFIITLPSCIEGPEFPDKPNIDFERFSRDVVEQNDSFRIYLHIEDGDGDLGIEKGLSTDCDPCDLSGPNSCIEDPTWDLFLIDDRTGCMAQKKLPFVKPLGNFKSVEGKIRVSINKGQYCCRDKQNPQLFCPTSESTDTVNFWLFIKDRSGKHSDTLYLPPLILECT